MAPRTKVTVVTLVMREDRHCVIPYVFAGHITEDDAYALIVALMNEDESEWDEEDRTSWDLDTLASEYVLDHTQTVVL